MNIRRILSLLLACLLCLSPLVSAEEQAAVMPEEVRTAIDLGASLCDAPIIILPDGSFLEHVRNYSSGEQLHLYQGMDVKSFASYRDPDMGMLALTSDGMLHYNGEKVAEKAVSACFCQSDTYGAYIDADGMPHEFSIEWSEDSLTQQPITKFGSRKFLSVADFERYDVYLLTEDGTLVTNADRSSEDEWMHSQYKDWNNLVYADAAKYMVDGELVAFTIAGIQKDGTVLVAGDFAEEILSWGELTYLSMSQGVIVGLLKDGSIRITGMQGTAFWANSPEMHWENIATVNVSRECMTAIGTDGKYYFAHFESDTLRPMVAIASEEEIFTEAGYFLRFMPDGTAISAESIEEGWADGL